jgi:tetratricopeptide (TPR) repeat protein
MSTSTPIAAASRASNARAPAIDQSNSQQRAAPYIRVGLFVLVAIAFSPAIHALFINFDDAGYLFAAGLQNPQYDPGLSLHNVAWVFTHPVLGLYHPITILSLMIDYRLFGINSAGFHTVNVLIHAISCVLLFQFLQSATGSLWRSALAAAIFAIHPLRVESVLWVAERKDVLYLLFGLVALNVYVWYSRAPSVWKMLLCGLAFECSLLSKPMLLTLPFVLLLLDYWPLNRLPFSPVREGKPFVRRSTSRLLAEKSLLFGLVLATIALSIPGVFDAVFKFPLGGMAPSLTSPGISTLPMSQLYDHQLFQSTQWHWMNVPIQYTRYLEKTVDFSRLAAFYPTPRWQAWEVVGATAVLIGIFLAVYFLGRQRPWIAVGWLWFFGALVPVTLNQISYYSLADRYTYFPMIGLLLAIIWSIPTACASTSLGRRWLTGAVAAILTWLGISTYVQAGYWHSSQTLWQHAIAVTDDNWAAHYQLSRALSFSTDPADLNLALQQARITEGLAPEYYQAPIVAGHVLLDLNRTDEAIAEFRKSALLNPRLVSTNVVLAILLYKQNRFEESGEYAKLAVQNAPGYSVPYLTLAADLSKLGKTQAAIEASQKAIDLDPKSPAGYDQMGDILQHAGDKAGAEQNYSIAGNLREKSGHAVAAASTTRPDSDLDLTADLQRDSQ